MLIPLLDNDGLVVMLNPEMVSLIKPIPDKPGTMRVDVGDSILQFPKAEADKILEVVNKPSDNNSDWVSRFITLMPLLMNTGCRK